MLSAGKASEQLGVGKEMRAAGLSPCTKCPWTVQRRPSSSYKRPAQLDIQSCPGWWKERSTQKKRLSQPQPKQYVSYSALSLDLKQAISLWRT